MRPEPLCVPTRAGAGAEPRRVREACRTSCRLAGISLCCALLAACAATDVTFTPSPQAPVCDREATALVLWSPQWRADQKDVAAREDAAAAGLGSFFAGSACFARAELRRVSDLGPLTVASEVANAGGRFGSVVTIAVRELGPVVKLFSSAALVDGGTEVVLQVGTRSPRTDGPARAFTLHWRNGGPGVVKGVAGLPGDMSAALRAGLQPPAAAP